MEVARKGQVLMLRLDHGEDVLGAIQEVARDEDSTMVITAGLGMITDFELGYFDRGNYIRRSFSEPYELIGMQGSVASRGDPRHHVHVTVADKEHRSFGGHLLRGKVWMSNEICLLLLQDLVSRREVNTERKVAVLHFGEE